MNILPAVFKASLLCLSLCTGCVFSELSTQSTVKCPLGSDLNDVNERVQKFASQGEYYTEDEDYHYKLRICQRTSQDDRAVQQHGKKWPAEQPWTVVGKYIGAHVTGGSDWLMIKYFNGDKYRHHCTGLARLAVVLIICDPGEQRGSVKIIEEYRNKTVAGQPLECYYLFELNHDAACTVVKPCKIDAWFITLIILVVLETVYIILGCLYQRYVVRAKGLGQCGGCDVALCIKKCWCSELCSTRCKTTDAITDDNFDNNPLPVLL